MEVLINNSSWIGNTLRCHDKSIGFVLWTKYVDASLTDISIVTNNYFMVDILFVTYKLELEVDK